MIWENVCIKSYQHNRLSTILPIPLSASPFQLLFILEGPCDLLWLWAFDLWAYALVAFQLLFSPPWQAAAMWKVQLPCWTRGRLEREHPWRMRDYDRKQKRTSEPSAIPSTLLMLQPWQWGRPAWPTPWEVESSHPTKPDRKCETMNKYIAVVLSHRVWGWFIRHQRITERKVNAKKNAKNVLNGKWWNDDGLGRKLLFFIINL